MSRRSLLCVTLALAAVGLGGCTSGSDDHGRPGPSPRADNALRLAAFDSCQELAADLRAAAQTSVTPYGFAGTGGFATPGLFSGGARVPMAADGAAPAAAAPAAPAFSGTNINEAGADEPDLVKTDGQRIVTVARGTLTVVDAATRRVTGRLDLGVSGRTDLSLLLAGDRALVLVPGNVYWRGRMAPVPAGGVAPLTAGDVAPVPSDGVAPEPDDGKALMPSTRIGGPELLLVDLTGTPRVISRYNAGDALVDARQTGNTARVVLSVAPRIMFPAPRNSDAGTLAANRSAIAKAPVDAWLPTWSVTTGDTTERGTVGCDKVSRPAEYSGGRMLTILTFDLAAPKLTSGDPVAIVADGDTVYANGTSLYVANDDRWRLGIYSGGQAAVPLAEHTEIYRFDTPAGRPPVLRASGSVPGTLVNQYALSEWDGNLRVATTDEATSSSAIRVLAPQGDTLTQIGAVTGLGRGERIYAVRYLGARGYVVTFKQTDPLYSVDLSDPRRPRVTGALKITGFSAHLQPVGTDRLVGIGQEVSADGRTEGVQVSLFDTAGDQARRLAQYRVGNEYSAAENDPHALLYWPATRLLVVPMTEKTVALRVDDGALTPVGTINEVTQRALVIGSVLWTVGADDLRAADLSTLDQLAVLKV